MSTLLSSEHNFTIQFASELHPRFSCCICLHVADEPLNCGNKKGCTGVFCTRCLNTALVTRKECPLCKIKISGKPTKNNIVKEMIYDEIIYCTLSQFEADDNPSKKAKTEFLPRAKCQWTGPLKDLAAHIVHDCEFAPTPCTNEGCTLTLPRGQLALHRDNDCQFRLNICFHCISAIRVNDITTHTSTCGKVTLTCTDCSAPCLRENQAAHDLACLEKPTTCPFACHGCTTVVLRKGYNQHQIDNAITHSELLATEMSSMKQAVTALQSDMLSLRQGTTPVANPLPVWTNAAVNVVNFDCILTGVSKLMTAADKTSLSESFSLQHNTGISRMYVYCEVKRNGKIDLYLYKSIKCSSSKEPVSVAGSTITLLHPSADPSRHVTRTFVDGDVLSDVFCLKGWTQFVPDVKPFIFPNDTISIKCVIKYP